MKHLRIFIWNDDLIAAADWQKIIAGDDAPEELKKVPKSTAITVEQVVQDCFGECPDVVLLDIKSENDTKMGLKIAEAIRKRDLLIPILAVTKDPKIVYLSTDKFEKLGFAGIFHKSVMTDGVFKQVALRPSLNQWHLLVPEFPLVRHCIRLLRAAFGAQEAQFVQQFTQMLEALPFSRSIESWHQQIRGPLSLFMERRNMNVISTEFLNLTDLFESSDPFYMAGSKSRRHLSHNVQVFLIGLASLLGLEPLQTTATNSVMALRNDNDRFGALVDAILIWACIANTHDVAYLSETFGTLVDKIGKLSDRFAVAFSNNEELTRVQNVVWPTTHHGKVAADLWKQKKSANAISEFEKKCIDLIAAGIERHDSKYFPDQAVQMDDWSSFLAVVSDELQDWGRERLEQMPGAKPFETVTWGMFCLEGINISMIESNDAPIWSLALTFIARDHPEVIMNRFGMGGKTLVQESFARIARNLRKNLRSSIPIDIELKVNFVSRPSETPIYEIVQVRRQ